MIKELAPLALLVIYSTSYFVHAFVNRFARNQAILVYHLKEN